MFRIDVVGNSASLPTPAAAGTPGYFQDGDPLSGTEATVVSRDWANHVQEEIAQAIEAAGITLDKTEFNQLALAIPLLAGAGFTGTLGMPGHVKLPGGWMIQWWADSLTAVVGGTPSYARTLPVAFPVAHYCDLIAFGGNTPPAWDQHPGIAATPNGLSGSTLSVGDSPVAWGLGVVVISIGRWV